MSWGYRISARAVKLIKRFPKNDRRRVFEVLEEMKDNPFAGDLKIMRGENNLYRRRVGNYRIYFRPNHSMKLLDIPEVERKQSR